MVEGGMSGFVWGGGVWAERWRGQRVVKVVPTSGSGWKCSAGVRTGWAREAIVSGKVSLQTVRKMSIAAEMEPAPVATKRGGTLLVWLQSDLRVHDNPALSFAAEDAANVQVIYIFDRRILRPAGKVNSERELFLRDSLQDLQKSLQAMGGTLALAEGEPETLIPQMCKKWNARGVVFHRSVSKVSIEIETKLTENLKEMNAEPIRMWTNTMYNLKDTPFNLRTIPWEYEQFEKEIRQGGTMKDPLPPPKDLPKPPRDFDFGRIPDWIGVERSRFRLAGGETAALKQFQEKLEIDTKQKGKEAKAAWDIRPWLELGCLSPRSVRAQLKKLAASLEPERLALLEGELFLWDFFRFISLVRSIMNIEAHLPKDKKSIIP